MVFLGQKMFNRIKLLDIALLIIPIILTVLGIALIYSLVFSSEDKTLAFRQGLFALIGLGAMVGMILVDFRSLKSLWWIFYLVSVFLLIIVDIFGHVAGGAMRWINLGFFQLQPSEIAKIGIIVTLASFFSGRVGRLRLRDYIWSAILLAIPFGLILKEPDLGTAMVVVFVYLVMLFYSRPSRRQFIFLILSITVFVTLFVLAVFNIGPFGKLIQPYQRSRVEVFLNPGLDPYGQGYNVRQAEITIGSGGLFGHGLGQGSQSQLKFLPKPQTDFIFAGVAEAIGFVGSGLVILLYFYLIERVVSIAGMAKDSFGMLVAVGVAAMLLFQVIINVGMNLGLMPVTGIPLPFLSYGGTSLIISFFSLGIIQSIYIRKKKFDLIS